MAEPRRALSRRAALSYQQLKNVTTESGAPWADILLKDYQGILQDSTLIFDEIDALDDKITALTIRVEALEYKVWETVPATTSLTAEEFQIVICKNTSPIDIILKPSALKDDEIRVKRRDAPVTIIGVINGKQDLKINVKNSAPHLVFDGTDWSTI